MQLAQRHAAYHVFTLNPAPRNRVFKKPSHAITVVMLPCAKARGGVHQQGRSEGGKPS
jgi:hypothetical protein